MNEHELVERAQEGLNEAGVQDTVTAAGIFMPRGHFGGAFAGGLVGDSVGGALGGGMASSVGTGFGAMAGMKAVDEASGLPDRTSSQCQPRRSTGSTPSAATGPPSHRADLRARPRRP